VVEFSIRHVPILLVLLVACANVGTLIYARTATREAEIAMRSALGATRSRIVAQLFVEALVLASLAAAVGLAVANFALKWGLTAFYAGGAMPFWVQPGLKPTTVIFAAGLTILGAALLGILPALKATGRNAQMQLKNVGSGGATLTFGRFWTTAMIAQVALAVVCIPPAWGIGYESWRDREVRSRFPGDRYLAVRVEVEREAASTPLGEEPEAAVAARVNRLYRELERRFTQEPGVAAVTFADRLPGMGVAVRRAEVDVLPGAPPREVPMLWTAAVGPRFFETFDIPIVAGRDFHDADRLIHGRAVLVNEAFARRYFDGANPLGRRVRYASDDPDRPGPWLDIIGVVKDVGMTPTDLGEAPYVYHAASPASTQPLVMGVRVTGDPAGIASRLRAAAGEVDAGIRLADVATLEDLAWRQDLPGVVVAIALAGIVGLGLFLSAAGIFSLMSVSVARRTKEIALRAALGASTPRLLAGVLARALLLIGSGIGAGNGLLLLLIALHPEAELSAVWDALVATSSIMLTIGVLACIEPARRALRINPTDALKEA
jgi:predicted permease